MPWNDGRSSVLAEKKTVILLAHLTAWQMSSQNTTQLSLNTPSSMNVCGKMEQAWKGTVPWENGTMQEKAGAANLSLALQNKRQCMRSKMSLTRCVTPSLQSVTAENVNILQSSLAMA